ncbi:MAG: flippase-like domain-containing protein [Rhodospirillales bacterium]|nr:flippase-like domain-containing protein [Rhodospirillales bacterium]
MKWRLLMVAAAAAAVTALVAWVGVRPISAAVWHAAWAIPVAVAVHAVQLAMSGRAWRLLLGKAAPGQPRMALLRWLREAINSMLPVAQIGGGIATVRMLAQTGMTLTHATAATTLDVMIEAAAMTPPVLVALALLGAGQPMALIGGFAAVLLGLGGFFVAQRMGLFRLAERFGLPGLHDALLELHANPGPLLGAGLWHLFAWLLGTAETWVALLAMGADASLRSAFILETLGMVARAAGFAVPGALGVQEAGFVVVGQLVGIPADAAIAVSMIKRVRELLVGLPGLIVWQAHEGRLLLRRARSA